MTAVTRKQVRRFDQLAMEALGIPGTVLMENAGRNAAQAVLDLLRGLPDGGPDQARVAVVCGGGNNGGDGYVVARHLHIAGVDVVVHPAKDPVWLTGDALCHFRIARNMGLRIEPVYDRQELKRWALDWAAADVIVDGLLGTGFSGQVRPHEARVIEACNAARRSGTAVVAIDVPSGLDCDTGCPGDTTIVADLTVTFVARKAGFTEPGAEHYLGRVIVADIGAPTSLIERVLVEPDLG